MPFLIWKRQHVLSSTVYSIMANLALKFGGSFRVERVISLLVYKLVHQDGAPAEKVRIQNLITRPPLFPSVTDVTGGGMATREAR